MATPSFITSKPGNGGDWDPNTRPIDYMVLASHRSPGFVTFEGAELKRILKVRQLPGMRGMFVRYWGDKACEFVAKITLSNSNDWAEWHAWKSVVLSPPAKRAGGIPDTGALNLYHPTLADIGINAVIIQTVSQPVQVEPGVWEIKIGMLQYLGTPKLANATPDGAKVAPVDPVEQEIKRLTDQVKDLAAQ